MFVCEEVNYTLFSELCSFLLSHEKITAGLDHTAVKPTPQEVNLELTDKR